MRILVLFLTQLVLWTLLAQLNHYLAPLHVSLFAGGLYIAFAALRHSLRSALAVAILGGMLCDAGSPPVWFGSHSVLIMHTLLFCLATAVVIRGRDRLLAGDTVTCALVALLANLAFYLAFSVPALLRVPEPSAALGRLAVDLFCSEAFILLAGPWFFALQNRALALARTEAPTLN